MLAAAMPEPTSPADPQQLRALREGCALAVPAVRAPLALSGADHREWLERLASASVRELPAGRAVGLVLMDGKGRLRADLRAAAAGVPDGLLLDVPEAARPALLKVLDMYVLREKVVVSDLSPTHTFVHVLGPGARMVLTKAGLPAPQGDEALAGEGVVAALASRHFGAEGADLLVARSEAAAVLARLQAAGAVQVERAALEVQRIAAGVPWWPADLGDAVIPLEAGLDADVSITKGCYPGQEVVARIVNLGQVARRLLRLSAAGPAELSAGATLAGTAERAGQEAGKLTSVAWDPVSERTVALGFVRRPFWKDGTVLRAGDVELGVAELRPAH
jgi:folate-binding protein YgfZ